jgi:hypothetical protein
MIQDDQWPITDELRAALKKGFFLLMEYSTATGQPCPGSKPCKSPNITTPIYAGLNTRHLGERIAVSLYIQDGKSRKYALPVPE